MISALFVRAREFLGVLGKFAAHVVPFCGVSRPPPQKKISLPVSVHFSSPFRRGCKKKWSWRGGSGGIVRKADFGGGWREARPRTHLQAGHRLKEATPAAREGGRAAWARLCGMPKRAAF